MRSLIAVSLVATGLLSPATEASACAAVSGPTRLLGLHPQSQGTFFAETEPSGTGTFEFSVYQAEDPCATDSTVRWTVATATAEASDIQPDTDIIAFPGDTEKKVDLSVPLYGDSLIEEIEWADVSIENERAALIGYPSRAPVYIIDDDGVSRISFGKVSFSHFESSTSSSIVIPVFRSGPAGTAVSVPYTLGGGSSTAQSDDHTGASGTLNFGVGDRVEVITFTTKDDGRNEEDETVVVSLGGAGVDEPSSATVTIVDNDSGEIIPPRSRFHHPKHNVTYDEDFWKVFEYHVYAKDNDGGTGLATVEMGLRKMMKSGSCKWWTKPDWVKGGCHQPKWVGMRSNPSLYPPLDNGELLHFLRNPDGLVPSMGTRVKNYTVYSRARDLGGNTETDFQIGRNKNVFEVRPAG